MRKLIFLLLLLPLPALAQDKPEPSKAADKPIPAKPKKELPELITFGEVESLKLKNKLLTAEKLGAQIEALSAQMQTAFRSLEESACRGREAPTACAQIQSARDQIEQATQQQKTVANALQTEFGATALKHGVAAEDLQKYTVENGGSGSEKEIQLRLKPKAGPPPGFAPAETKPPPK